VSVVKMMGEYFQNTIYAHTHAVFAQLGITIDKDNIWHDLAQTTPQCMKSTFYIKGVDNVVRKDFHAAVAASKLHNPQLTQLKVKSKRPGKEVRFYLEVTKSAL